MTPTPVPDPRRPLPSCPAPGHRRKRLTPRPGDSPPLVSPRRELIPPPSAPLRSLTGQGHPAATPFCAIPGRRSPRPRRRGFSFLEILVASIFLMAGLVYLFTVYRSSHQGTLDSYRETIAYCLATEGLEWVAGLGYENLVSLLENPGTSFFQRFRPGEFVEIRDVLLDNGRTLPYPDDYRLFKRKIDLTHDKTRKIVLVEVTVVPIDSFLRRESVFLARIVGREYD